MIGWRARLGFLVPPGNPTVETEMIELAPQGVSLHFQRMVAYGVGGALDGQSERNQMMIDHLDESVELLAMVEPNVIVIAHTATSYHLGREAEAALLARLREASGVQIVTAFGSVLQALRRLDVEIDDFQPVRISRRTGWKSSISPICRALRTSMIRPPSTPIAWHAASIAKQR